MQTKDLTIGQVSRITGYAPASLRSLARDGQLPGAYKLGGSWRVNREQFERHRNGSTRIQTAHATAGKE